LQTRLLFCQRLSQKSHERNEAQFMTGSQAIVHCVRSLIEFIGSWC